MKPFGVFKSITELVVSAGAGAIIGNTVRMTMPIKRPGVLNLSRPLMVVGGFVLSNMVGDIAAKYAVDSIDKTVDQLKSFKQAVDEAVDEVNEAGEK